jgi:hypothetical protein
MFPEASRQKCEQRKNKEQSENVTWETINLLFDMLQRYLSGVPNTSVPKKNAFKHNYASHFKALVSRRAWLVFFRASALDTT